MREEMRSLGNEIVRSYDERISGIAQIKSDTSTLLKHFHRDHTAMSRQLKADLAKSAANLKRDVNTMLKRVRTELAGARDEWQKMTAIMRAKRGAPIVPEVKAGLKA
jgi:hypothetical protein